VQARAADRAHYRALVALIGGGAPTMQDLDLHFPRRAFGSRARAAATGTTIVRTTLGVYITAAAAADAPAVRALAARATAAEAQHLSALALLAGSDPIGPALPRAMSIEAATRALTPYWG
jgi:ferritin-like protein